MLNLLPSGLYRRLRLRTESVAWLATTRGN